MIRLLSLSIIITLFTASCKKIDASKGVKSDHTVILGNFNKIELESGGILNYTEDSSQYNIVFNTTQDVMNIMNIRVEDSTLIIGLKNGYSLSNSEEVVINIHSPLVKDYTLNGIGQININRTTDSVLAICRLIVKGTGTINVNQMDATSMFSLISGSGDINLHNLNSFVNYGIISGSGDLALYGFTERSELQVNGIGNIYSYPLQSYHTKCDISGSASMRVQADSTLDVTISGYGNIFYKGYPVISTNITGDGTLVDDN